jgi:CO/xanthine dehydrogenase Mo-binding subunit
MVQWAADVVRMRTTHDGNGGACGVVTGMGATAEAALAALRREAEALAQQLGEQAVQADEAAEKASDDRRVQARRRELEKLREEKLSRGVHPVPTGHQLEMEESRRRKPRDKGPWYWRFEVVDVRLTPGLMEGGGSGWLAYGTLALEDEPQQANTSGRAPGPVDGAPRVPGLPRR